MMEPLELLKLELDNDSASVKVNAIHRLPIIIYAYENPEQKKKEIIKFLSRYIKSCDVDEVLFRLGRILTELTQYFGIEMLELLERLMISEETVVREEAIKTLVILTKQINQNEISNLIIPSLLKLRSSKKFPPKASALNAMTEIFPFVSDKDKKILLSKIVGMISEDSLILRRNLARNMGFLSQYINKETLVHGFINQFKNLALDDSDSVRIICIESLVDLANVLTDDENKSHLIPIIIQLTGDKSWKVKLHLAKCFAGLAKALGKDISENSLFSIFSTLLRDLENEVRIEAVKSLKKFVELITEDKLMGILAYLQTLAKDTVPLVRTGVCEVVQAIFNMNEQKFSKEMVKTRIQPIIIDLLNDSDLEVKIEAIKLLKPWSFYSGNVILELFQKGTIKLNIEEKNWRLRMAAIEALMNLSLNFKNEVIFDKYFKQLYLKALMDKAFKVREFAVKNIETLASFMSENYLIMLCQQTIEIINDITIFYSYRVTCIYSLEYYFFLIKNEQFRQEQILNTLVKLIDDKLSNIRLVALRIVIKILLSDEGENYKAQVEKVIQKRKNDPDREVNLTTHNYLNMNKLNQFIFIQYLNLIYQLFLDQKIRFFVDIIISIVLFMIF